MGGGRLHRRLRPLARHGGQRGGGAVHVPQTSAIERELEKAGFGLAKKEISEISLEELMAPDEPCVGVATAPTPR